MTAHRPDWRLRLLVSAGLLLAIPAVLRCAALVKGWL